MSKYIALKESVSNNVKRFYDSWEKIVNGIKTGILPLSKRDGTKTDSGDQQPDILDIPEQKKIKDSLCQIKQEQKSIDMMLFEKAFDYNTPDKMLQILHCLKRVDSYN